MKRRIIYLITILFARPAFYGVASKLFHLALRLMGVLNYETFRVSGEKAFLRRVLGGQSHPVVLDVGANEGAYAREVVSQNPRSELHCFEPHPETYRRLFSTASELGFRAHCVGCSAENGSRLLYDYPLGDGQGGGSTHASLTRDAISHGQGHPVSETLVKLVKLDDFCMQNNIDNIRLLKIDTEGHELEVLIGARELINKGAIQIIQFEFNEMNLYTRVFFQDFVKILVDYRFFRLLPNDLLSLDPYVPIQHELFAFQNIAAIHKDIILHKQ